MQAQERLANEEAEKRLKAALTAKREPSVSQSRVASPLPKNTELAPESKPASDGPTESKSASDVPPTSEDVSMEPDPSSRVPTAPEVYNLSPSMLLVGLSVAQSPWLPQLEAIFEDVQKILPNQAYDVLGCVSDYPYQVKLIDSITVRVFMSRFGNYLRMIFPHLLQGMTKKVLLSELSVDKRMANTMLVKSPPIVLGVPWLPHTERGGIGSTRSLKH